MSNEDERPSPLPSSIQHPPSSCSPSDLTSMHVIRGFSKPELYRRGFVSIGNFDGVHRGHQTMIAALVEDAKAAGVPSVVLTFDPHPIALLRPEHTPPNLCTVEHKAELLNR